MLHESDSYPPLADSMCDKKENCGLFGIYGDPEAVQKTFYGLFALQHRGQESAGIASSDGESIECYTSMGTVQRVFRSGTEACLEAGPGCDSGG